LSCAGPSVEQWFTDAFANQEDVPTESAATLVVYLAPGAADVLPAATSSRSGTWRGWSPGRPRSKSTICACCVNGNSPARTHQHRCLRPTNAAPFSRHAWRAARP
jgi:hypothetical protein